MRKFAIYIILLAVVLVGIILSQGTEPKPIDYTPTFSKKDKIPYGTRVFYELLKDKYTFSEFQDVDNEFPASDSSSGKKLFVNHFIIKNDFEPYESEISTLLHYAEYGDNVFIAANSINNKLSDTLHIQMNRDLSFGTTEMKKGTNLVNPGLKATSLYYYNKDMLRGSFSKLDSDNITILGKSENGDANFIQIH